MPYPIELIERLAARHGLSGPFELMPDGGMINEAWKLGETAVLRIVRPELEAGCDLESDRERLVVPLATAAGVSTPELLASGPADDGHRPYTIYEFAPGRLVGMLPDGPTGYEAAFEEVGRQIAKLHQVTVPKEAALVLRGDRPVDTEDASVLPDEDAAEVRAWFSELERVAGDAPQSVLAHNDIHGWNLLLQDDGSVTILDWGDASFGDPAADFTGLPLNALPYMLKGYAEGGGVIDEGLVARALLRGTSLMLWEAKHLDATQFGRHWWRFPPGGWPEAKRLLADLFPE